MRSYGNYIPELSEIYIYKQKRLNHQKKEIKLFGKWDQIYEKGFPSPNRHPTG